MYRTLSIIVVLGGVVMAFIGAYVLFTYTDASTAELQEDQMWIALALLAGGIGLTADGLTRVLPAA